MKVSTKLAMAFLAMATTAGTPAFAEDQTEARGERGNFRFERADSDSSGDITYEEFAAATQKRIGPADKDGDGNMTIAEIASEIERMRAERMARRIVERFDADGMLTAAEIESRQKKMFALMDRNDDGKIGPQEMARRGKRH